MSQEKPSEGVQAQKALDTQGVKHVKSGDQAQQALSDYSKVEENGELSMYVRIYSPFREYYDGQAFSISAVNATGPFDILPKHHSFISLLSPCDVVIRTVNKGDRRIRIGGGLMHVKADQTIVFLDV
jgi:hypothetical protein